MSTVLKISVMREVFYVLGLLIIIKGPSFYDRIITKSESSFFYKEDGEMPDYELSGIDISRYQTDITWEKIDTNRIKFIFIKATEGIEYVDPCFNYNWVKSKEHNIIRGAYHYFLPDLDPKYQALNFIANVDLREGDLPPVIDVEETRGVSASEIKFKVKIFCEALTKAYKVNPIIYCNKAFYNNLFTDSTFAQYPKWIAHYNVDQLTMSNNNWHFWQHSDKGKVAGISGHVDLNVFNGSMAQLKSLTIHN